MTVPSELLMTPSIGVAAHRRASSQKTRAMSRNCVSVTAYPSPAVPKTYRCRVMCAATRRTCSRKASSSKRSRSSHGSTHVASAVGGSRRAGSGLVIVMDTPQTEITAEPPVHGPGPHQPARRPPGEGHQVPLAADHDELDVAAERPQRGEHLLALPDRAV